jgi:membrane fusion protein (multidrug efflux system)
MADATVDPATNAVTLRVVFANPDNKLLPGMYVRAVLEEGVVEQALLAPQQGVSRTPRGEPMALVVGADNKVEMRVLEVSRTLGDKWLVSSGLEPGAKVIVEGVQKVQPGMVVKPVPFGAAPPPGAAPPGAAPANAPTDKADDKAAAPATE